MAATQRDQLGPQHDALNDRIRLAVMLGPMSVASSRGSPCRSHSPVSRTRRHPGAWPAPVRAGGAEAGRHPLGAGGSLRHSYAILEAPSALGHIPEHRGVERAPGVLLEAGLADGLNARRAGCLPADGYSSVPDQATTVMNSQPLHDYSRLLADQIG